MTAETEKQRDEIHRKIGRNVILLQRIEMGLKSIIPRADISLSSRQLDSPELSPKEWMQQQRAQFASKTMGCLSRLFCERILDVSTNSTDTGELSKGEARFKFSFRVSGAGGERCCDLEERLQRIVNKRNRIVHQVFTSFNPDSTEGLKALDTFLDEQHKEALTMFEDLKGWHEHMRGVGELVAANSFSVIQNGCLDFSFVQMLVVVLLWHPYAFNKSDEDGWSSLALAGQYLRQYPEALAECKKKFKTRSLKKIIVKTELFDIKNEDDQVLYRIKPEYWLEVDKEGSLRFCKKILSSAEPDGVLKQELDIILASENHLDSPQSMQ